MAQQHNSELLQMLEEVVSAEKKDAGRIVEHFHECRSLGIEILPPDINLSEASCVFERENALRLGFSALGCQEEQFLDDLLSERRKNGPFQSFQDLCERIDAEGVPESFFTQSIQAGMFDGFGESRARLFEGFGRIIQAVRSAKAEEAANQISLFANLPSASQGPALSVSLPEAEPWSEEQRIDFEKEALGFSFTEYFVQLEEEQPAIPEEPEILNEAIVPENLANVVSGAGSSAVTEVETANSEVSVPDNATLHPSEEEIQADSGVPDYLDEPPLPDDENFESEALEEAPPREPLAKTPPLSPEPSDLSEASFAEKIVLQLPVQDITETHLLQLRALCEKYSGQSPLFLEFIDEAQHRRMKVQVSQKYYVQDSEEMRKDIQALFEGVDVLRES